jgi:hypothetical protein
VPTSTGALFRSWEDQRVEVELHLLRLARLYALGFSIIWCVAVAGFAALAASQGSPFVVIPILMLVVGVTIGVRLWRLGVIARGDEFLVSNYFQTRHLTRAEIEGFRVGTSHHSMPFGRTIYVLLRDESVLPLDVTTRPFVTKRQRARFDAQLNTLRRWVSDG